MERAQGNHFQFFQTLDGHVICFDAMSKECCQRVMHKRDKAEMYTKTVCNRFATARKIRRCTLEENLWSDEPESVICPLLLDRDRKLNRNKKLIEEREWWEAGRQMVGTLLLLAGTFKLRYCPLETLTVNELAVPMELVQEGVVATSNWPVGIFTGTAGEPLASGGAGVPGVVLEDGGPGGCWKPAVSGMQEFACARNLISLQVAHLQLVWWVGMDD